jgi:hypothetical protein
MNLLVKKIHPPPATMCYRGVREDHVASIIDNMCTNQGFEPKPADMLIRHVVTGCLCSFQNTEAGKKDFLSKESKGFLEYIGISGQHSALAAKKVIEMAHSDKSLAVQADLLMNRRCQILSADTPTDLLVDLSKKANIEAKTYVASFVHSIQHVRNQYIGIGRPPKGV